MDRPEEIDLKLLVFGGILVILLLSVSIISFFIIYQKRLLAQQIRLQQVQNDNQRQLLISSIDAEEKERARIGHDLHDEIGSALSTIKLLINQIHWHNEESHRIVINVKEILSNTIQDVRNISYNLYPTVLSKFGLTDALQNLAISVSEASGLSVQYDPEEISNIGYNQALALYRITQELVNNAVKHANATQLIISLRQSEKQILLEVRDDGIGIDKSMIQRNEKNSIGLKSIEARTTMLQADLQMHSEPNKGTTFQVRLPFSDL